MKIYGGTKKMKRRLIVSAIENAIFCGAMYFAIYFMGLLLKLFGLD